METSIVRPEVELKLDVIRARHWSSTAHNIELPGGVYTIGPNASVSDNQRGDYFAHVCMAVLGRNLHGVKVLDLGCLEGGLSIQFARLGAHVDGLNIRPDSIAKARFAAKILKLDNVHFFEENVLDLLTNKSLQPAYDVSLCAGLLYHLDAQDHLLLTRSLAQLCKSFALIDTHIALEGPYEYRGPEGLIIRGRFIEEGGTSFADRRSAMWSGWENNRSFWATEPSLQNTLDRAGFAFVTKARQPVFRWPWKDRSTWLAFKGHAHAGEGIWSSEPSLEVDERTATHPNVEAGFNISVQR